MSATTEGLFHNQMIGKYTIGTGMSKIRLWKSTDDTPLDGRPLSTFRSFHEPQHDALPIAFE
jgi:hypothetical protein